MRLWFVALLIGLGLVGCSLQPQDAGTQVEIAPDVWVGLPQPQQLRQELIASQLISATWQDEQGTSQSQQLPVQLQISNNRIVLAGFSSWGTRILSLDYDGESINTQVLSGLENTLPKPEQVLFNLMITLWPRNAWEAPLNQVRWSIIDENNKRIIKMPSGETVIEITYLGDSPLNGNIQFENKQLHYSITIQTLSHQLQSTTLTE